MAQVVLVTLQLVVLGVAAVYAKRQVDAAKRQVAEAVALREEQARPFVVVDFDAHDHVIDLVVSNLGNTLARDVRFRIDPPFASTLNDPGPQDLKMLREGISSLAPGKQIRTLFDAFTQRENSGLPDAYEVVVSYADEKGRRRFEETLDLDIGIYRNLGSLVRYGVHDLKGSLDKIQKEMHRWTAGTRGLLTLSPEERRAENERLMQQREEQRSARDEGASDG